MDQDQDFSNGIPTPLLRRWAFRAFVVGFRVGALAGIAALMN
jgi:hypothetical protein